MEAGHRNKAACEPVEPISHHADEGGKPETHCGRRSRWGRRRDQGCKGGARFVPPDVESDSSSSSDNLHGEESWPELHDSTDDEISGDEDGVEDAQSEEENPELQMVDKLIRRYDELVGCEVVGRADNDMPQVGLFRTQDQPYVEQNSN